MHLLYSILIAFLLSSCHSSELKAVRVLKIFDGDSFLVEDYPCFACEKFQVRLLGIDAPEGKQKPWGDRARDKLNSLISAERVIYLEYDLQKIDKYKRHLAYAFADEEKQVLINEQMIDSGHAELFAFAKDLKYLERFKKAEIKAQQAKLGIWDEAKGLKISPYKYRRQNKA